MARVGGSYLCDKKGGQAKLVHRTKPAKNSKKPASAPVKKSEVSINENA